MSSTKLDTDTVRSAAAALGRIMDDLSAFDALRADWPKLGNFDLAAQLDAIVDDRRSGVLAHADQLKTALEEMGRALMEIATEVQSIDDGAAAKVTAVVADLRTRVHDDLAALNQA
ncbi:hypothetical protein [Amycolatopsis sp. PS_44_ISF1]|uniref:hypothetical protein n=1 Tax=Amycolatopsis sp. PS_44_ISF1 TaxID=2974917 RepID=UPI0028E05198|nr:hypothetical protein [Amycolatopsis sp. PS_44_ISF1]MDT8912072.1 hypothetical protein [Amycolatopsis sp. PS_44_ISF1]